MPVKCPLSPELAQLHDAPAAEQARRGYADTLREILQQPQTWQGTAARLAEEGADAMLRGLLAARPAHIVFTGSGSSVYVGECLAPVLQAALGVPCLAIPAGTLLTSRRGVLPPGRGLLVSIARSGDSPESTGVVDQVLAAEPGYAHLAITCNAQGRLATRYRDEPRMHVLLLDERTNDRSLVMTSSFTNLLLAGSGLRHVASGDADARVADAAAAVAGAVFARHGDALARVARAPSAAAVYLGSGAALGAARESALKMLEMSGGAMRVLPETFLGLRHGPMSWLDDDCLTVAYLSGEPSVRGYEYDLLRELNRKALGGARVVVGESIPGDVLGPGGVAVELPGLYALEEAQQQMIHVVVGQLLAFFRCLALEQRPDAPSQGVLTRVVESFAIHAAGDGA
ncbi:SIS domain-containing protein [Fulvimonas soli]|jgi:tagatose-6-phosphate ketose/aldose isomerase|uniref:Tagatose-6-phosphate ketose/aldose isomerase n=1 Tax=Fulvimonas soli TaxID=155197 RepID=A0A316IKH8_9GAMM|nr:tagatose-6-phosphate ketose isomerase [Fulvimonas soli]PWK87702.1 tagatose-6-phosphate ketose/aldose isomerase [Fulvimonas soli]TNY27946.1 tagatose-6-phosphate ketose isomerase [Fulvimonas soli]